MVRFLNLADCALGGRRHNRLSPLLYRKRKRKMDPTLLPRLLLLYGGLLTTALLCSAGIVLALALHKLLTWKDSPR